MPNETYEIEMRSPLLRPGIVIRTEVSKKYVVSTIRDFLDMVREINTPTQEAPNVKR
jgi:hypothetical protein